MAWNGARAVKTPNVSAPFRRGDDRRIGARSARRSVATATPNHRFSQLRSRRVEPGLRLAYIGGARLVSPPFATPRGGASALPSLNLGHLVRQHEVVFL